MRSPSQLALLFAIAIAACGGGDGPGGSSGDGGSIDSAPPSECDGLGEAACTATDGCEPVCSGAICDCECPQVAGGNQCGCAGCSRDCYSSYDTCATTERLQECGDQLCNRATHICVVHTAFTVVHQCVEIPERCLGDRVCSCLGPDVCDTPSETCVDDQRSENQVACECPACA